MSKKFRMRACLDKANADKDELTNYEFFVSNVNKVYSMGWRPKTHPKLFFRQNNPWMPEDIEYYINLDLDMNFDREYGGTEENIESFEICSPTWRAWVNIGDLLVTDSIKQSLGYKESEKDKWTIEYVSDNAQDAIAKIHFTVMKVMSSDTLSKIVELEREKKQIEEDFKKLFEIQNG